MKLRLDVAYDGAEFSGWARQPNRSTVQGVLEDALSRVLRSPVSLAVAGRTDAGVHATGQVCSFDAPEAPDLRRLNGVLPTAIRVLAVTEVPETFDARFSALSRRYVYRISDAPFGVMPLFRNVSAHPRELSIPRLRAASRPLLGLHDFAAFCRRREGATTIRDLKRLTWARGPGRIITATLEADAFCHQMVRSLVGALLLAGDGRREVSWPGEVLARGSRDHGAPVAPACGLTLVEVRYPAPSRLAARAAATRHLRT